MEAENVSATLKALAEKNAWDEYDFEYEMEDYLRKPEEVRAEVVTVEYVEGETGGEDVFAGGEGDIYHIIKVTTMDREQFFKKTGKYYSYAGSDWSEEWVEVKPTKKTITVYE